MPKQTDWGERKLNQGVRITPTARDGLQVLAQSLGLSMNEMLERIGRCGKEESAHIVLRTLLTELIVPMHNKRVRDKANSLTNQK